MSVHLPVHEERQLASLAAGLEVIRPGEDGLAGGLLEALEAIGIERPHTYMWHERAERVVIDAGFGRHFDVHGLVSRYPAEDVNLARVVRYDPRRVVPEQVNRAVLLEQIAPPEHVARLRVLLKPYVPGMHDQLRVLLCEGTTMLGWVGGFARRPFTEVDRERLQRLVPVMQRRLVFRTRLDEAGLLKAALDVALEALPGPSLILDEKKRVVHRGASAGAVRPDAPMELTPIESNGVPRHYLATVKRPARPLDLRRVKRRHGLTEREAAVLSAVVSGATNRAIAGRLAVSERTVEVHLERLLEKTGTESRASLVARVWKEGA